jgi:hypothetical protein
MLGSRQRDSVKSSRNTSGSSGSPASLHLLPYLLLQIFFILDLGVLGEQSEETLWLLSYRAFTHRE